MQIRDFFSTLKCAYSWLTSVSKSRHFLGKPFLFTLFISFVVHARSVEHYLDAVMSYTHFFLLRLKCLARVKKKIGENFFAATVRKILDTLETADEFMIFVFYTINRI